MMRNVVATPAIEAASRKRDGQHVRQHVARRETGDEQSADREHRELLEPAHARCEEREIRDRGRDDRGREQRPERAHAGYGVLAGTAMTQQADRIFLRDAEQREAERERDAVRRAEHPRERGDACKAAADDRQCGEQQQRGAPVREQQKNDEADRADRADAIGFAARLRVDQHAEVAGSAEREMRALRIGQRGECRLQRVDGVALRGRIETRAARLGEQECRAVGCEPDAVAHRRRLRRRPALGERERFERRIARQDRFQQRGGGRREIFDALLQLIAEIAASSAW